MIVRGLKVHALKVRANSRGLRFFVLLSPRLRPPGWNGAVSGIRFSLSSFELSNHFLHGLEDRIMDNIQS